MHRWSRLSIVSLTAALAALITACGGGGSSEPPPPSSVTLSKANYSSYTSPMARGVLDLTNSQRFTGLLNGQATALQLAGIARLGTRHIARAGQTAAQVTTSNAACNFGGSLQIVLDDKDNNGALSAGDTLTVVALNCHVDAAGSIVNGGFTLNPTTLQLDGAGNLSVMVATGSFNAFAIGPDVLNGGFTLSIGTDGQGTDTISFGFTNTTSTGIGPTIVHNTTFTETIAPDGTSTSSVSGSVKIGGASFSLTQPSPFLTPAGALFPTAGAVQLIDGSGNLLSMTAKPGELVDFALLINGVVEASLLDQPWSLFAG